MKNNILEGLIDIHVHVGPSVAERIEDAVEMYKEAAEAGYKAFVVKDHYFPSMIGTTMIEKHMKKHDTKIFGCLCMNNSVGGINLNAVDAACNMGAKIIFMPTVSAKNHIDHHQEKAFVGAGKMSVLEEPIYYLDENDNLKPEVIEVLKYLSEKQPDVILGTGHGSAHEIDKLIDKAIELNIKKILVNHPFFHIGGITMELVEKWAKLGAYIEINAVIYNEIEPAPHHIPISIAKDIIDRVGCSRIVLDSDLGQKKNIVPVLGMKKLIEVLMNNCSITEEEIEIMAKINPANLLGI